MRTSPAFSLIELLIVVGLIGLLGIPALTSFVSARANQALVSETEQLVDRLRETHIFARDAKDTKSWGISSNTEKSYTIVSGSPTSFTNEKTYLMDHNVSIPSPFTVWFDIGTGEISGTQTIVVKGQSGVTKRIIIYTTGVVEILPG